jgi:23S rRNA (cytidine1920-2'-O)/16S rRNA (cytidine1409-2'-O)-methyltransferase
VTPIRLDLALVERGLARSRNQAAALIESGRVFINGKEAKKSSQQVASDLEIVVLQAEDYVSRAGHKLAHALKEFDIAISGKICLDVGASTGGFTDVLLRNGASQVIALDVGHDQINPALLEDQRVINLENVNAREIGISLLTKLTGLRLTQETIKVVVADLSFISLTLVIQQISEVAPKADMVLLIKPQFEVGKSSLEASGIVNDYRLRAHAIRQVIESAKSSGLGLHGLVKSPLPGTHGNQEYLAWFSAVETNWGIDWSGRIDELAKSKG